MKSSVLRLFCVLGLMVLCGVVWGYSPAMRRASLGGPWELRVSKGKEGGEIRFPVEVEDESKPTELKISVPLMGSATKIRIEKYVPDLQWDTYGVRSDSGGVVAKVRVKGPKMDTAMWLNSSELKESAISSRIGGIKVVRVYDSEKLESIAKSLVDRKALGIVTLWIDGARTPVQVVACKGKTEKIGEYDCSVKIVDYLPHYSVNRETKKVTNASERPLNPALKVKVTVGEEENEEWLWSRIPISPHARKDLPYRAEFSVVDIGESQGRYMLLAGPTGDAWVLSAEKKKRKAAKLELNKVYPLMNEAYGLSVEEVIGRGKLEREWKNGSEILKNPAIIVAVEKGDEKVRHVLELNKPTQHNGVSESMALVFAKKGGRSGMPGGMGGGMPPGMGGMKKD